MTEPAKRDSAAPETETDVPERRQRGKKETKAFTELYVRNLNGRRHLEKVNEKRRKDHRKAGRPMSEFKEVTQDLVWDEGHTGLALLVGLRTKTFRVQFKLNGQHVMGTLGRFGELVPNADPHKQNVQVTEARRLADEWRALAASGIDPREQQPQQLSDKSKPTYEYVVDQFIEHYAKPRQRTWDQTQRVLKNNCAAWLKKPIADIPHKDIRKLLREFITDGHPYKTAVTKRWLAKLWKWAYDEEHVPVPIIQGLGNVEPEKRVRDRFYSDDEIKATWAAADKLEPREAAYVKLLILLAPRKTALACLRRSHLDIADNPTLWTTPFELTKSRKKSTKQRVYLTPLPPLAQRIVKGLTKISGDHLFPGLPVHETRGGRPTFYGVELKRKLVEHGAPADFEFHAWRHTIATWLQNKGIDEWERGLVLNHAGSGNVTAGYSHGYPLKLKLESLTKWADHVERLVAAEGSGAAAVTRSTAAA
jgi:integrase